MKKHNYTYIIYLILFFLTIAFIYRKLQIESPLEYIILFVLFIPILYGFLSKKEKIEKLEKEAEEELEKKY